MELSQDSKGISYEEQQLMDESDDVEYSDDDSQEDPTFDALEETRVNFSNLSIKAKSSRRGKRMNEKENEEAIEVLVPELNEQDKKSYENIQKIIEGGQVDKLKVDQCKIYLRKHGLRLSGNKETLIQRIKEHVDIVSGGGEKKYPASSFVLNCKGDACTGDVVMFEQNVYEMFSIASRSATGPPCGTRVVAGRIVKESYGAAKQQHTFTIEVLWSRGEKPLPPLHQLLIKGRNLYRLKTLRQRWEDEGERQRNLAEKHARGDVARLSREARIQQRETRKKTHKTLRETRNERPNISRDEKRKPRGQINQPNYAHEEEDSEKTTNCYIYPQDSNANTHVPRVGLHQRQPLTSVNCSLQSSKYESSKNPNRGFLREGQQHVNYNTARGPIQSESYISNSSHVKITPYSHTFQENQRFSSTKSPSGGYRQNYALGQSDTKLNSSVYSKQTHACNGHRNTGAANNPPFRERDRVRVQTCRYYAQERCHFGDRCKYLHGS